MQASDKGILASFLKYTGSTMAALAVAALAGNVLIVFISVVWRYALHAPLSWTEEVATHLLAWVALLGGAVGFSRKQHLGVDFIYNKLHPSAQRLLAIISGQVIGRPS